MKDGFVGLKMTPFCFILYTINHSILIHCQSFDIMDHSIPIQYLSFDAIDYYILIRCQSFNTIDQSILIHCLSFDTIDHLSLIHRITVYFPGLISMDSTVLCSFIILFLGIAKKIPLCPVSVHP